MPYVFQEYAFLVQSINKTIKAECDEHEVKDVSGLNAKRKPQLSFILKTIEILNKHNSHEAVANMASTSGGQANPVSSRERSDCLSPTHKSQILTAVLYLITREIKDEYKLVGNPMNSKVFGDLTTMLEISKGPEYELPTDARINCLRTLQKFIHNILFVDGNLTKGKKTNHDYVVLKEKLSAIYKRCFEAYKASAVETVEDALSNESPSITTTSSITSNGIDNATSSASIIGSIGFLASSAAGAVSMVGEYLGFSGNPVNNYSS